MMAQPSLYLTLAPRIHPCVVGMNQRWWIWRTTPANVVVDKRSQQWQWRLLLDHPRCHPRSRRRLNYCPLETRCGMGPRTWRMGSRTWTWAWTWKMHSRRMCTRLSGQKSPQDHTQVCLYGTWVCDCNYVRRERKADDAHHHWQSNHWRPNSFCSEVRLLLWCR